jgi:hypothetical protein
MFNADEIDALVIGMRMVQAWGGPQLGASAASALAKVVLALPKEKRDFVEATPLFAPAMHDDCGQGERLEAIRQAIGSRHKLLLHYTDAQQRSSQRVVWPLALAFLRRHLAAGGMVRNARRFPLLPPGPCAADERTGPLSGPQWSPPAGLRAAMQRQVRRNNPRRYRPRPAPPPCARG